MESEELCEIVGDLSEAYSHTCKKVQRRMRREPLRGDFGVLVVEDEVESRSEDFKKSFNIHCQSEHIVLDKCVLIGYNSGVKYILACILYKNRSILN